MSLWPKAVGKAYRKMRRDGVITKSMGFVPINRGVAGKKWYREAQRIYKSML